jgi:hypothetical protein
LSCNTIMSQPFGSRRPRDNAGRELFPGSDNPNTTPLGHPGGFHPYHMRAPPIARTQKTNDEHSPRYEDGEVRRFGAGESYRPFNRDRSPRAARSPPPRDSRARTPPPSDRYKPPERSPRRRSRSGDRFRQRERSREADTWRRRERDRSRSRPRSARRSPPRRSPSRRSPPHFGYARRDDRGDRARSPRRDSPPRDNR